MRICPIAFLSLLCGTANGEPVMLPAGMNITLQLQHHVNSSYSPVGSPVYFRVAQDVRVGDKVLIAKGALVAGRVEQATERGMVGKAGMMTLAVDKVPAVDGTVIPVDADFSKQGRSRGAATVGWTIFWGLPGLITKGVNPYMIKGEELQALVRSATAIEPTAVMPPADSTELGPEYTITEHRWKNGSANGDLRIDIERHNVLGSIKFRIGPPAEAAASTVVLGSLRLLRVDDVPVPEDVQALSVAKDTAEFDAWSIARYCGQGTTNMLIVGTTADGGLFHATHELKVEIKKKN